MRRVFSLPLRFQVFIFAALIGLVPFAVQSVLRISQLPDWLQSLILFVVLMLFMAVFMTVLHYRYFRRIDRIVENIGRRTRNEPLLPFGSEGNDEIDRLGHAFLQLNRAVALNMKNLQEYQRALDESNIVTKSDLGGRITYANKMFYEMTGYTPEEVIGKPHNIVRHPETPKAVFADLWATIQAKKTWRGILKNLKKNGDYYIVDITILPILDEFDEIVEYIAIRHDVTELEDKRSELESIATRDNLTGLGNRNKLIAAIHRAQNPGAVIVDIDRFSEINDFYGHQIGDMVIVEFANRLFQALPKGFELFRYYADRFVILADNPDRQQFVAFAMTLAQRLSEEHIRMGDKDFTFQTTAGISFEPPETLISSVEMAVKHAKRAKQSFIVYDAALGLEKIYEENILWAKKITDALRLGRFIPYFQPILNNATGRIEKYEALARMIDDDGTIVPPGRFIDVAKRSKQYLALTRTIFDQTLLALAQTDAQLSVNLTMEDIADAALRGHILGALAAHPKGRIVLELVESEGIENFSEVAAFIEQAKNAGALVAIDDFGTGYSNFSYLLKLKVDFIKIDGSLIRVIDTDEAAFSVVETITDFARKNGIGIIAEFVSGEAVLARVRELNICYSQGYLIGQPQPDFIR
ncbi:MAG: EAL domain-containing protein [Campylobacterales bacterium]